MTEEKYNDESRCLKCFDMISRDKLFMNEDGDEVCDMCYSEKQPRHAVLRVNFTRDMPIGDLDEFIEEFKNAISKFEYIKTFSVEFEKWAGN